jgi:hypothetical protein
MLSRTYAMSLFWTSIEEVKNFTFLKQREGKRICRIYHFTVFSPLAPALEHRADFQFHDHFTEGRTPWTGDQLVARPLPKYRTTQTLNKRIHTQNIRALCGLRTHNPGFRASEDSTCLRPFGYLDRPFYCNTCWKFNGKRLHFLVYTNSAYFY